MAKTAARSPRGLRRWPWPVLALLLVAGGLAAYYSASISGYGRTASAYSARVACSCRFVAERTLEDCEKDKLAGMELVMLSEDVETRSVTATFPLVASETARLKDGYGCVLDSWDE